MALNPPYSLSYRLFGADQMQFLLGMAPFGSLGAGTAAKLIGPRGALLTGAGSCLPATLMFARHLPRIRDSIRPIYVRMGILSETGKARDTT